MTLEEFKKQLETTKKNLLKDGWKMTTYFNPDKVIDEKGNEHLSSVWYGDTIACLENDKYEIIISPAGDDIDVTVYKDNEDNTFIDDFKDRDCYIGECLRKYFKNDEEVFSGNDKYVPEFDCGSWYYNIQLLRTHNEKSTFWEELICDDACEEDDITQILSEDYLRNFIKKFDLD